MTDNEDNVFIITHVSVHVPGPTFSRRVEGRGLGSDSLPRALGDDTVIVIPPGDPLGLLPRHEALKMIEAHGGRIISEPQKSHHRQRSSNWAMVVARLTQNGYQRERSERSSLRKRRRGNPHSAYSSTNGEMTYLSKFNLALAAVLAGTRNARILFMGDETTAGAGANGSIFSTNNIAYSFPTQLAPLIATATGLKVSTDVVLGDNGLGITAVITGKEFLSQLLADLIRVILPPALERFKRV
jgi:hypothetical protein